jgi:hypothetical protein
MNVGSLLKAVSGGGDLGAMAKALGLNHETLIEPVRVQAACLELARATMGNGVEIMSLSGKLGDKTVRVLAVIAPDEAIQPARVASPENKS